MEKNKTVERNHHAYTGNNNTKKRTSKGEHEKNNVPDQPLANVNDDADDKE